MGQCAGLSILGHRSLPRIVSTSQPSVVLQCRFSQPMQYMLNYCKTAEQLKSVRSSLPLPSCSMRGVSSGPQVV